LKRRTYSPHAGAACGFALVLLGAPAAAQVDLGRIDLTVEDATGAVLPGAAVTVTGPEDRSDIFTDVEGEAHLLRLPVGTYQVSVTLQGFSTFVDTGVQVRAASSTPLVATLEVGGVEETVLVSGTAPVIDPRRQSTDTHVTLDELQEIPSSRDPWVVLQTIPGVIVDRVNVGGAESGQQSNYMAKGASSDENTWTLDGVVITAGGISAYQLQEPAEYLTTWLPLSATPFSLLMNRGAYESLSAQEQEWVDEAAASWLSESGGQAYELAGARGLQIARDAGVELIDLSEEEKARFLEAVADVYQTLLSRRIGDATVAEIIDLFRGN